MTHRLRLVMEPWPPNTGEACPASMDHRVRNGVYWAVSSDASGATYLNIMCHAPPATMAFPDSVKQAWNRRRDHVPPTMASLSLSTAIQFRRHRTAIEIIVHAGYAVG